MDQAYLECITMNLLRNTVVNCTCPDISPLKCGGNNRVFKVKVNGDFYLLMDLLAISIIGQDKYKFQLFFIALVMDL